MTTYRDAQGKALTDYPHPSVAVDTAVLTVADGSLAVLLVGDSHDGTSRLPGTFLHEGERLADAVARSLADKAGVVGATPRQLHVFDALDRDDRGWVLSVAHLLALPATALPSDALVAVASVGPLAFDHTEILGRAVTTLREQYLEHPDPWHLLGNEPFTLLELERLHRAIDPQRAESKDTFRRLMEPQLRPTRRLERGTVGKPARLFTHSTTQPAN